MSESTGRERAMLSEIERQFSAENPRLVRRLRAPSRWTRWWWGISRAQRYAVLFIALLVSTIALAAPFAW